MRSRRSTVSTTPRIMEFLPWAESEVWFQKRSKYIPFFGTINQPGYPGFRDEVHDSSLRGLGSDPRVTLLGLSRCCRGHVCSDRANIGPRHCQNWGQESQTSLPWSPNKTKNCTHRPYFGQLFYGSVCLLRAQNNNTADLSHATELRQASGMQKAKPDIRATPLVVKAARTGLADLPRAEETRIVRCTPWMPFKFV